MNEFLEVGTESMATARAKTRMFERVMARLRGDWWEDYKKDAPPEYLQPPWASAPSMSKVTLPEAPKPMPPPAAPEQGFQGAGKFYPPPPAPPPSPPPPLPPPPPAPAASYHSYHAPASPSPIIAPPSPGGASFKSTAASLAPAAAAAAAPEPRFKSSKAQLLVAKARGRAAAAKGADVVQDAMFSDDEPQEGSASADEGAAPASPASPAAAPGAPAPAGFAAARFAEAKADAQSGAKAGAQVGGDAYGGKFQFQYYDPNNPPPWLLPKWNSGPRSHVAAPAVTSLNSAAPTPYPANPSTHYWNGYTPALIQLGARASAYGSKRPTRSAAETA